MRKILYVIGFRYMVTGAVSEAAGDSLSGIENVTGTVHGDSLTGNASENVLTGGYGDDTLIGGDGADVVNYDGNFAAYDVVYDSAEGTFTVTDKSSVHGDDGTDTLSGIETVVFEADGVAIDLTKAPIAYGAKARVDTGGEITWTLKTAASDLADGTDNSLTYALEEGPAHGHTIIHANGRYTYLADAGYDGFGSFTYRVTDSRGLSSVATIDMGVGTAPAGGGGALDFNGTDAHLSWTRAAAGDSKTWTYSFWARGDITSGSSQKVLSAGPDGDNRFEIYFNNSQIGLYQKTGTTVELDTVTTAIDNTPDEWVHYVVAVDTTADTESGRVSVYRNGAALGFDPDYAATFIAKDTETFVNGAQTHRIGVQYDNTDQRFRGGLADVALVEGQALAAASFAAHDATDGWRSKDLSGLDFGTGGVYLDFAEATDVGRDVSGNGIAITLNGVTAGNWSVDGPPTAALDGDDAFVGGLGDDSIRGDAGDDLLIGGEGNDTLDGGSGRDTVRYNGARADYDVVYDASGNLFTVTDLVGSDGVDTLTQVGTIEFAGETLELDNLVNASNSIARVEVDGSASWTLTVDGGEPDENGDVPLTYALEPGGGPGHGTVTLNADGTYDYTVTDSGYQGIDRFTYRVTDSRGLSSIATVTVGVGVSPADEFQIHTTTAGDQYVAPVAAFDDGGFVITWASADAAGTEWQVFGQRFDAGGVAVGDEFVVSDHASTDATNPQSTVAAFADGGFVVAWDSYEAATGSREIFTRRFDADGMGIFAQRYDADGNTVGGETLINSETADHQEGPVAAGLADGGYVIAWQSKLQDGSEYGIYGQRYDASGTAVGSEFAVNTTTAGNQDNPRISALADGGFVVTWASDGQDGDARGVYARRYDADGNPVGPEVLPTVGNDSIEGTAEADVLDGLAGDDLLIGGEGNDTLSGGAGVDTASYAGSEDDYDIVYDGGTGLLTVTDTNAADGDSGTDTLSGVESLTFDQGTADTSDDMTVDLTGSLPAATDGALQIGEGGSASWTLTGPVGDGLSYALEGDTDEDGEITTAGGGTVTLTDAAKGEYTYQAGVGQKGADSFQFRVTDSATGVSSVATVDVGVGSVGYTVDNALSLNGTDEYLSWTPGTAGDSKSWTVSLWLKPSALVSPENLIYQAGNDGNNRTYMAFTSTGQLRMMTDVGAQRKVDLITTDSFVDPNKWQHVVFFYDSTVASPGSSNVGIIVDGQQVTAFDTEVYPPQNTESYVNGAVNHYVGRNHFTSHFDGSLAEVVQVDGQALDASAFGEFDADGTWVPVDVLPSNWPVLGTDVLAGTETVTVSDTASSDGPEVVYDDDTSAQWQSANGTSGKYWQVDLGAGQEQAVERVNFMSANDMNGDSAHNITSLQVKGSVDGSTWVTLADVNPSSWALNQMHAIDFSNDTAYRHYRLEKAAGGASGGLNLKEVELLARDATATDFGTNGFHLDFADGTAQAAVDFIDAGATITASSGQWDSGGNALVNMIDGDAGTYWHSASQGTSHTVTLSDFGAAKRPSQYRIHFQDDNANSGLSFTQIQFEGWNGSSWQVIDTQTSGFDWTNYSWYEVDVNASEAYEQVRWTFTKSLNYYMHSLMEFEVLYEPSGLGLDASGNGNDFDVTNLDETNLSPDTPTSGQFEGVAPTEGNDSIEGTIEADVIDGLSGDDQLIGNEGADTLSGGSGDDLLIGGEGDDTLSGGSGVDTARYAGAQTDYDVLYDGATGLVTVADLEETLHGNDGTDTLSGIETLTFDQGTADTADDVTIDVSGVLPVATDSAVQIQVDGSASWTLTGPVGDGLSYSLEGDTDADGTITTANGGTVTLTDAAKGEYTYQAGAGQTGADSFQFRVTDATGVSSTATVDVGVGSVGYTVDNALSLNGTDEYLSWTPGTGGTAGPSRSRAGSSGARSTA